MSTTRPAGTPVDSRSSRAGRPRALVTGGAGFVGSHLVDRLVDEGVDVLVIDDISTGRVEQLNRAARLERLDIAEADLGTTFRDWRAHIVFHLAAQSSVPASMASPLRDLAVNVVGTHRVVAAAKSSGAGRLVFVSSGGAVFGEAARSSTELTRPAPSSYYGIHKLAAEGHVALSGLPYAIARPSNIYGPRQAAGLEGAVIASFLEQARGGTLRIHGDGSQSRDFVNVRDVVDALWLLGQTRAVGMWIVASGRSVRIAEVADLVEVASGRVLGRAYGPRRPGDVTRSALSPRRLRSLGWRPSISLGDGIRALSDGSAHDFTQVGSRHHRGQGTQVLSGDPGGS